MHWKKYLLAGILLVLSFLFGFCISQLDFFGFLTGGHSINLQYLFFGLVFWYLINFLVFLLDFSDQKNLILVFLASAGFFLLSQFFKRSDLLEVRPFINTFIFYLFLFFLHFSTKQRARLFVKFSPREIFLPIIRASFIFLLIMLGITSYLQGRNFQYRHGLISSQSLYPLVKPVAQILNQQLNSQFQQQIDKLPAGLKQNPESANKFLLNQTLEQLIAQNQYGLKSDSFNVEKVVFLPNAGFDLTPMLVDSLPALAEALNKMLLPYLPLLPLLIYLIIVLLISPFLWLTNLIFLGFFLLLIRILLAIKFLTLSVEKVDQEVVIL